MEIDIGGPAFPTESAGQTGASTYRFEGMTLRDYFAAKAINGLVASSSYCDLPYEKAARMAYSQADAMLETRKLPKA